MRQHYEEWRASGLSKSSYCREKGIVKTTFYYWVKKFQSAPLTNKPVKQGFKPLILERNKTEGHPLMRVNLSNGASLDFYSMPDVDFVKSLCSWVVLALSNSCRYFLYRQPTDMRYGINSLAGLIRNELHFDPMGGDVFVFLGKRKNQIRLLQWDHDGFAMYIKKLEKGTFEWPKGDNILISNHQLTLLLQGVMLESVRLRSRWTGLKKRWK